MSKYAPLDVEISTAIGEAAKDISIQEAGSEAIEHLQENGTSLEIAALDHKGNPERANYILELGQLKAQVAEALQLRKAYKRALALKDKEIAQVEYSIACTRVRRLEQQQIENNAKRPKFDDDLPEPKCKMPNSNPKNESSSTSSTTTSASSSATTH